MRMVKVLKTNGFIVVTNNFNFLHNFFIENNKNMSFNDKAIRLKFEFKTFKVWHKFKLYILLASNYVYFKY